MLKVKKINSILKKYPYIASAYLFGSYTINRQTPLSDIDIAVLLKNDAPTGKELIRQEDFIAACLTIELKLEVDLINLNKQGLIFQHNVLKSGKLIYDVDKKFRVRFETEVINIFCDFEPTLRLIEKYRLNGIKKRCENF